MNDCQIFFPLHDTGTDLLITKGKKHIGIQVKELRSYKNRNRISENSFHQISKNKFKSLETVDFFYVFVTYIPKDGERKFEKKFLIVPSTELAERVKAKDQGEKYFFYFDFDQKNVVTDIRKSKKPTKEKELTNYSKFLNAWHLIENALI